MALFQKYPFLSIKNQYLLCEIFEKKRITFQSQSVYSNRKSFRRAVNFLLKGKFISEESTIIDGRICKIYGLTLDSFVFVRGLLWNLKNI